MIYAADLFCGAGGTSSGLVEAAGMLGKKTHLTAVNHWERAVETHSLNHPDARHLCENIDDINPRKLYKEGQLDVLWASPECTHHSIARGGRPINDQSRATAWCVTRWAEALRPNIILVENVPEFLNWGGIGADGRPLKSKKGHTFQAWVSTLESLGYRVAWRLLCAADYGDPTTRKRLFVQAVRGKRKIVWPDPTHGPAGGDLLDRKKWVPARDIIDWSLQGQSIYERKRPLADKTLARIERGLRKFGLSPFVAEWDHQSSPNGIRSQDQPMSTITTKARHGVVEPFLIELKGSTPEAINRTSKSVHVPLGTVCANGTHHALCEPMIIPQQSAGRLRPVSEPMPTVATAGAISMIEPFLVSYYGNGEALSINDPLDTVTTKERFGLARPVVEYDGKRYHLDIRFRMLQPHELAAAQGFPKDYKFAGNKTEMVKQIGNAVPRRLARALCLAALSQNNNISEFIK